MVGPHRHAVRARRSPPPSTTSSTSRRTSYTGIGIVKVFFQPGVDIRTANAQVTAISQTVLKQMPPGTTPPLILNYNASTVPIIQLALSGKGLSEQALFDLGLNVVRTPLVTVPGAAIPFPYGGKFAPDPDRPRSGRHAGARPVGQDVANALAAQNLITPVGTQKIGSFEYAIQLNNAPSAIAELGDLPIKTVERRHRLSCATSAQVRDGNPPQTNIVHVDGSRSVLMHGAEERRGLDARDHRRHQGQACRELQADAARRTSRSR